MSWIGFKATFENIEKLCDIVDSRELEEISIKEKNEDSCIEITIKGKKCPPPPPAGVMPAAAAVPAAKSEAPCEEQVSGNVVKSPIVGTFYAASAPDKPPFVKVGQQVKQGDVLFIIESMKVMNEVQSEFDGVVKEIKVNNGDALEFDQPVMIIG